MQSVAKQEIEKTQSNNKLLIMIFIILCLILLSGIVMAYFMLNNDEEVLQDSEKAVQHSKVIKTSNFKEIGPVIALDKFIVNLSSNSRYLRTSISLELSEEDLREDVEKKKPIVRDRIIKVLSSKAYEEISTIRGKEVLKEEILVELNKIFNDGKIQNIFFTEFVVQ